MTSEEIIKLVLAISGQEGLDAVVAKATEAKAALTGVKDAATEVEKKTLDLEALASQGKNLFGALQGGDVQEIVTGITGLTALIPGLAAFSIAAAAIGATVVAAMPTLKEWYGYLTEAATKMKEATTDVNVYTSALRDNTVALKESDAVAAAREADKKAAETPTSREKARADIFHSLLGSHTEEAIQAVTQGVHDERTETNRDKIAELEHEYQKRLSAIDLQQRQFAIDPGVAQRGRATLAAERQRRLDAIHAGEQGEAESLLAKAQKGDADAIQRLQDILPKGSTIGEIARMASPEEQEANRRAREDVAEQQRQHDVRQKQEQGLAAARDQVQRNIAAEIARHTREAVERARAEQRGPEHAARDEEAKAAHARQAADKAQRDAEHARREGMRRVEQEVDRQAKAMRQAMEDQNYAAALAEKIARGTVTLEDQRQAQIRAQTRMLEQWVDAQKMMIGRNEQSMQGSAMSR